MEKARRWIPVAPVVHCLGAWIWRAVRPLQGSVFAKLPQCRLNRGFLIVTKVGRNVAKRPPLVAVVQDCANHRFRAHPCPQRKILKHQFAGLPIENQRSAAAIPYPLPRVLVRAGSSNRRALRSGFSHGAGCFRRGRSSYKATMLYPFLPFGQLALTV